MWAFPYLGCMGVWRYLRISNKGLPAPIFYALTKTAKQYVYEKNRIETQGVAQAATFIAESLADSYIRNAFI